MSEQSPNAALTPPDLSAAAEMWQAYASARPDAVAAAPEYTVEHFGDHPALADELLALVLSGRKRATADLASEFLHRGDRTLATWTRDHREYWARVSAARGATWDPSEDVIFERFSVVWPPEIADETPAQMS